MIKGYFLKNSDENLIKESEICLVFAGTATVNANSLNAGQGIFCKNGGWITLEPDKNGKISCLCIQTEGFGAAKILNSLGITSDNDIFDFTICDELEKTAEFFFADEKKYENEMLADGISQCIFSYASPIRSKKSEDSQSYVEKTERYINENLQSRLRIDEIADSLGVSRGYLRNLFCREKGMSPQEYLMKRRIERALELLADPELAVTEIAQAVGYYDVLQFSRIFKKHMGISPSQYRISIGVKRASVECENDNTISESDNTISPIKTAEDFKKVEEVTVEPPAELDFAALAAEIEKAAAAAREEEERKQDEKKSPPPFWLL